MPGGLNNCIYEPLLLCIVFIRKHVKLARLSKLFMYFMYCKINLTFCLRNKAFSSSFHDHAHDFWRSFWNAKCNSFKTSQLQTCEMNIPVPALRGFRIRLTPSAADGLANVLETKDLCLANWTKAINCYLGFYRKAYFIKSIILFFQVWPSVKFW